MGSCLQRWSEAPCISAGVDNSIYALNSRDGSLSWSFPTGNDVSSFSAMVNGMLYAGSAGAAVARRTAAVGGPGLTGAHDLVALIHVVDVEYSYRFTSFRRLRKAGRRIPVGCAGYP